MDNFKDIFIKDNDIKGTIGTNILGSSSFFISERTNVSYVYVLKKTERIAGVVVLLINDLDYLQGLGAKVAEESFTLIQCASDIAGGGLLALDRFSRKVGVLTAMIGSLSSSSVLPQRSAGILVAELAELDKFVRQLVSESTQRNRPDLSHYLSVPLPAHPLPPQEREAPYPSAAAEPVKDILPKMSDKRSEEEQVGNDLNADWQSLKDKKDISISKKKDRRAIILSMLQKKDSITVKDVSLEIKDCSEKTLQRELLSLVAQGILTKHGERRWSAYSLR